MNKIECVKCIIRETLRNNYNSLNKVLENLVADNMIDNYITIPKEKRCILVVDGERLEFNSKKIIMHNGSEYYHLYGNIFMGNDNPNSILLDYEYKKREVYSFEFIEDLYRIMNEIKRESII